MGWAEPQQIQIRFLYLTLANAAYAQYGAHSQVLPFPLPPGSSNDAQRIKLEYLQRKKLEYLQEFYSFELPGYC